MMKGYKIRLYPTKEQEELFWKHIHACRFIWNYMLEFQQKNYNKGNTYIDKYKINKILTALKETNEFKWLNDVSRKSLDRVCTDLDEAFNRFFKKLARYPKYKSRKFSTSKFPTAYMEVYFKNATSVNISKCGKVRCDEVNGFTLGHRTGVYKNPRISYTNGKWILSFAMECENQALQNLNGSMGIDLGIKELAVVSHNGQTQVFHNINKSKKMKTLEKKKRYYQRKMDKMFTKNGRVHSKNREKMRLKFCKVYAKQTNIRNNYIHQVTHGLVQQKPERVVMESLKIKSMIKNKHLSRYILEQKFYMFIDTMRYKCEWAGIKFILADRFYPSSKTCSYCGHIKKNLKLSDRVYKCENCGLEIDRDENAARNLEKYND